MFKYCPNCTSEQISCIDELRFHCPVCDFDYYHNTGAAVAGIIRCNDEILFNVRSKEPAKGMLDLPGGFVDFYEPLEQALTREVREELGIDVSDWHYLCSHSNQYPYNGITYHTCDAVFVTTVSKKPTITLQKDEVSDYCWLPIRKIDLNKIGFGSLRKAVAEYIK